MEARQSSCSTARIQLHLVVFTLLWVRRKAGGWHTFVQNCVPKDGSADITAAGGSSEHNLGSKSLRCHFRLGYWSTDKKNSHLHRPQLPYLLHCDRALDRCHLPRETAVELPAFVQCCAGLGVCSPENCAPSRHRLGLKADPLSLPGMDPNHCIHRALTLEGEENSSFT